MHRKWKQGGVSWAVVCLCRDRIRKAKVQIELNLARDVKDNKKGFYKYIGKKEQAKESVPLLIRGNGELAFKINLLFRRKKKKKRFYIVCRTGTSEKIFYFHSIL